LRTPLAVNAPLLSFTFVYGWITNDPYSEPWAPRGMDFDVWWAMLSPVAGIIFWWLAGRGIDAIVAIRKKVIFPRIRKIEAMLAAMWACFGLWLVSAVVQDLSEIESDSLIVLGIGGALWTLIGGVVVTGWFIQRRMQKRSDALMIKAEIRLVVG